MKLFVDCTLLFERPDYNTGIPRVVRNIIKNLDIARADIASANPVIFRNKKIYQIKKFTHPNYLSKQMNLFRSKCAGMKNRYRWYYYRSGQIKFINKSAINWLRLSVFKVFLLLIDLSIIISTGICRVLDDRLNVEELEPHAGDVLILLDSPWRDELQELVDILKDKGLTIVTVVYDLIPLAHPQFCTEHLVWSFKKWLDWAIQVSVGFMAISQTVMEQMKKYVQANLPIEKANEKWFDYFYLGSELDLSRKGGFVRHKVKEPFQHGFPSYLMVGTIEPRKNHNYLLNTFDILWRAGYKINLVFVGKAGWKCRDLIKRIRKHHLLNKQLFLFNDLNDTELEYCYNNSRCLLFSSFVEGFGLPLIEAMQRGIPVMVSDIPVFREIGGDSVAYFDPHKPETVVALIRRFEESGELLSVKSLSEWSWPAWENVTRIFLTKILFNVNGRRNSDNSIVCNLKRN